MLPRLKDGLLRIGDWGARNRTLVLWTGAAIVAGGIWFGSQFVPSTHGWSDLAPENADMQRMLERSAPLPSASAAFRAARKGGAASSPPASSAAEPDAAAVKSAPGTTASPPAATTAEPDAAVAESAVPPSPETTASPPATPARSDADAKKISINTASAQSLTGLPGIGPSKAQAIVDYRSRTGGFKSLDELKKVKGIGPKTYEALKELITL